MSAPTQDTIQAAVTAARSRNLTARVRSNLLTASDEAKAWLAAGAAATPRDLVELLARYRDTMESAATVYGRNETRDELVRQVDRDEDARDAMACLVGATEALRLVATLMDAEQERDEDDGEGWKRGGAN